MGTGMVLDFDTLWHTVTHTHSIAGTHGDMSMMPLRLGDQQQKHCICLVLQGSG